MVSAEPTVLNEIRRQKGMEIAKTCRIMHREKGGYVVPSQSGNGAYIVRYVNYEPVCECQDYEKRHALGIKCKHIWAVEITLNHQVNEDGTHTITKTVRATYSQDWCAYDHAKTHEKETFLTLLNDLCQSVSNPEYSFGRPRLALGDMVFASALKVYSTFSLRRFVSDMAIAKEKGLIDKVPHYSSVALYMEDEDLTPVLLNLIAKSSLPLRSVESTFALDSSGFSTSRFARWYSFKYGKEVDKRVWIKAHISCGTKTNVITSVKITESNEADCPQFCELVSKTSENFSIGEVSADKAYLSVENLKLVEELGGTAFIPFKSNSVAKARNSRIWKKMYHFFMFNREEFLDHYHKRSNSETVFHMIKSKFGDSVRSKTKTAQVNEVLLKCLCHNLTVVIQEMSELGIEPNFCVEKVGVI